MNYFRSVLSVLGAPVIYGMVCVPLLGALYGRFPELINEFGGTRHVPLLLATEFIQLLILLLCGYVTAMLAPARIGLHAGVTLALMLVIAVSVQLSYWDAVPVWHHFIFFASVVIGISCGAYFRQRQSATTSESSD